MKVHIKNTMSATPDCANVVGAINVLRSGEAILSSEGQDYAPG